MLDFVPNGTNLVANPSFETAIDGTNWTQNTAFTQSNEVSRVDNLNWVGKLSATDNRSFAIRQDNISTSAGVTYIFFGCARIPVQTDPTFSLTFRVRWLDTLANPDNVVGQAMLAGYTAPTPTNEPWHCFRKQVTAPAGSDRMSFRIEVVSLDGTMYVDDTRVQQQ